MKANEMYAIELYSDETFLSSSKNLMIISAIFQKAFEKYTSIYRSTMVSINFIEFYLNEIELYDYMFTKQVKEFFDNLRSVSPNIEIIANIYLKSFFSQCSKLVFKHSDKYFILKSRQIVDFTDDIINNSDKGTASAVENIITIAQHINNSDEIIPFYEKYENFMISKIINQVEFKNKYEGKSRVVLRIINNDDSPRIQTALQHAEKLTSERLSLSKSHGKVTKIIIHKLKLPSDYPKLPQRFDFKHRAKNFISASRQILLLNDLKINGVSYSTSFVEKRKAIAEM